MVPQEIPDGGIGAPTIFRGPAAIGFTYGRDGRTQGNRQRADIIGSVVSPTWQDIGELGAIAVIRTFLNYFLEKDLERAAVGEAQPGATAKVAEAPKAA